MAQKLNLFVISPSSYDDSGRLLQYYRILMKTSALTVLKSLVLSASDSLDIKCQVFLIDERLEKGEKYLQKIKQLPQEETLVFITVKSFELPRGIDIARDLRQAGYIVVLGGPGVTLADWKTYDFMFRCGLSFNVGEGELTIKQILSDFVNRKIRTLYWQKEFVDLSLAPLPSLSERREHERCLNPLVGISTSEGCPFDCSYCCITTLRGKNISEKRSRDPKLVVDWVEETHRRGLPVMLTDDNLRRSYHYETLKKLLIDRNERQEKKFRIFAQIDVAPGILNEIPNLAKMGIIQVFPGMETLDPEVLSWMKKSQNRPRDYLEIARKYREYGIMVNSGVMIGFPSQTPATIENEIREFIKILDFISINIATPFPGSQDYKIAVKDGTITTFDPNYYDLQHCCRDWFINTSPYAVEKAFFKVLFQSSTLRWRLGDGRSFSLKRRNIKNNLYSRFLVILGYMMRGRPYHYMMNGIPRLTDVFRCNDSFRGFALTLEDLEKKESYLQKIS